MAQFLVSGYYKNVKMQLTLPEAKHFKVQVVKNGEEETQVANIITKAVNRDKWESYHIRPFFIKVGLRGVPYPNMSEMNKIKELPRSLQKILSKQPYPLSQGPVLLPLDSATEDNKSVESVLATKTVFNHNNSEQGCYEWVPVGSPGVSSWGQDSEAKYTLTDINFSLQGVASTKNMGTVYTCNKSKCVLNCPCKICTDQDVTCKLQCRVEVCAECSCQCTQHEIKLPRVFDANIDHFTMVTQKIDKYQFANPYAGIPVSCAICSNVVLEHQVLHLVFHTRCKFCRHEMRPFVLKSVVTNEDYKEAEQIIKSTEGRTCSVCLFKCQDKYARRKHEETEHEDKSKLYKCDHCDKEYGNSNALDYHLRKHESIVIKFTCDLCGKDFTANGTLIRHKQAAHGPVVEDLVFSCSKCGMKFSRKDNLKRHNKEKHFGTKVNLDYVQDMDTLGVLECEQCDQTFKEKASPDASHQKCSRSEGDSQL